MDQMTAKEKIVVEELRKRTLNDVTPKMLEDVSFFYRFAKARDYNLAEAETMLRQHLVWRKEMKIDTILTDYEPPEALVKFAPTTFICFNKEGCVVRLQDCGRADGNGLWNIASKTDWVKFCARVVEQDIERVIKRGGNLGNPIYASISDFEGLTYSNAISVKNLQYLHYLLKIFADHYPEVLKTATIINGPSYFAWLFTAMKQVFPATLTQKLRIYGKDGWKEILLKENNPDDFPAYLGGNRTDPDGNPLCETFMKLGQPIPKQYYIQNKMDKLYLKSDVDKLRVMPFSKKEITFEVKEANSHIEWEFQTKSRDINFILLFRRETSGQSETVELIPKQRIDTSFEPEKGFFQCEEVGYYTIVFDNSDSWILLKEVYYRAGITKAKNYDFAI